MALTLLAASSASQHFLRLVQVALREALAVAFLGLGSWGNVPLGQGLMNGVGGLDGAEERRLRELGHVQV